MAELDPRTASTVISFVPFEIFEEKPGIYPGTFRVPASDGKTPQLLVVGESVTYVYVPGSEPPRSLEVKTPSYEIARSIVQDYHDAQLGVNLERGPALFWTFGVLTPREVPLKLATETKVALQRQQGWLQQLVMLADDDWEKIRQHLAITDMQRFAARALGLERPWLIPPRPAEVKACPACGTSVIPDAVICATCKCVVDSEKYKALSFVK